MQISLLGLFILSYALAIYHRRSPQVHSPYMACTALSLIDPIFARLFFIYPGVDFPLSQVLTYGLMAGILIGLAVCDGKHRLPVFLHMLPMFVVVQIPTVFLYELPWWRSFALWYGRLPLP